MDELEDVIDDLNDRGATLGWSYFVSAVIEDGAATTVVIRDLISDYEGPNWGNTTGIVAEVTLGADGGFILEDARGNSINSGTFDYEMWVRYTGQAEYGVAFDGTLDAANQWNVTGAPYFVGGAGKGTDLFRGASYYLVVDGVKSNTVVAD